MVQTCTIQYYNITEQKVYCTEHFSHFHMRMRTRTPSARMRKSPTRLKYHLEWPNTRGVGDARAARAVALPLFVKKGLSSILYVLRSLRYKARAAPRALE